MLLICLMPYLWKEFPLPVVCNSSLSYAPGGMTALALLGIHVGEHFPSVLRCVHTNKKNYNLNLYTVYFKLNKVTKSGDKIVKFLN